MAVMVLVVAQQCHALGLGDMQVESYLGEPLRARVALIDAGPDAQTDVKVRLATPEQYQKNGYVYPYDKKYRFSLASEADKQTVLHISSQRPIDDPYLDLLLEATYATGKVLRIYTVLIDPSPEAVRRLQTPPAAESPVPPSRSQPEIVAASVPGPRHADRPARKPAGRSVRHPAGRARGGETAPETRHTMSGSAFSNKLSLTLATSLTISRADSGTPLSAKEQDDALQEELIAKEKTLRELNEQIAEMNQVIKVLQGKLSTTVSSGVPVASAASGVVAPTDAQAVPVLPVSQVAAVSAVVVVPHVQPSAIDGGRERKMLLLGSLALLSLVAGVYYFYRKRKLESGWIPKGLFDDMDNAPAPAGAAAAPEAKPQPVAAAPVVTKTLDVGSQSMKVPAFKEQKPQVSLPAEFDLLEEANIYLRFGHDKLAEEVLRDALKINAANPDIYIALLGIFDTRGDAQGFEQVARQLKPVANEATWKQVAVMGKALDPGNPLYD